MTIIDPDDEPFDLSELLCPKCGCNHARIVKLPEPGRWFDAGRGYAVCDFCNIRFRIVIQPPPR